MLFKATVSPAPQALAVPSNLNIISTSSNKSLDSHGLRNGLSFADLPGELRNRIYLLAIKPCDIEIKWLKKHHYLTHSIFQFERRYLDQVQPWGKSSDTQILRPAYHPTTKATIIQRRQKSNAGTECRKTKLVVRLRHYFAALLLVNKMVHTEVITMFYSLHSFGFTSRSLLDKFMATINPAAKASITRVYINHETYGDPYLIEDIAWKTLHDARWELTCKTMCDALTNLKDLHIRLRINDHPLILNLTAEWAAPLLLFAQKNLAQFRVELITRTFDSRNDALLKSCTRVVRRAILNTEKDEPEQIIKPIKFEKVIIPKATKILKIVLW